ncbi:PREDICTED: PI-PLC X domain-containing protein 1 isoform X1 [Gavialis gangeticus]|uniref:PI-PLC X domain-containing protein 1 isoform X1 n=1 Tax=Gavialis gangeticus TaxID=94835 RepID=UPI00092E5B27|nr:PREDICTED: PI-PLC X domain-containing protein 1 isoform X1 [Gavialis gangeticus]
MEGPLERSIQLCQENSQWMSQLPESLWNVPLYNLSLPGSHDTMSYCLDKVSPVSENESKLLKFVDKCAPCIVRPIIMKWSTTQVQNLAEQLNAGIRYLDLRIAHKSHDPSMDLYFVHMIYTSVSVEDTLWEISKWLQSHPWEVVILACRNFDGLSRNHHCHLISCIKRIFHSKLCPRDVVPTLQNMWGKGYQVIISYDEVSELTKHCELWPAIPYWWGNKSTTKALIQYLEHMKKMGRPGKFFVAGINLTADLWYILSHPFLSLKMMTLRRLPCLNIWVKQQCPGTKKDCTNIIAADFIGDDDFVKDVIELNKKLNSPGHCHGPNIGSKDLSFFSTF